MRMRSVPKTDSKMASVCDSEDVNFQLNLTLDVTASDEEGPLADENDPTNVADISHDTTIEYFDAEDAAPTRSESVADENQNGAAIANIPDEEAENSRFYQVTTAQLDYIASQTMATSTKAQTRWAMGIFIGKIQPTCQANFFSPKKMLQM